MGRIPNVLVVNSKVEVKSVKKLAPALQDLIAGHVRMMFDIVPFALQHIRDGSVRGLAVAAIPSAGRR
jgi:tripartite-type tricarboxylate transporter receptor subunit TctC